MHAYVYASIYLSVRAVLNSYDREQYSSRVLHD